VIDVESKIQPDVIPATDADPLDAEWARYLAAIAMTTAATVVAIGVDSKVTIPNLSLVFVVPVIVAGVSLGLGPSLCSAIFGPWPSIFSLPNLATRWLSMTRRTSGQLHYCLSSVSSQVVLRLHPAGERSKRHY
jgi:K+-sensing histidine kinase KdpD